MRFSEAIIGLLFAFFFTCESKLSVMYPPDGDTNVDFSIPNFGFIPYGSYVIGDVIFPEEKDQYGCDELPKISKEKISNLQSGLPILFIKRGGGCHFVQKVRNAEAAGARLVIIEDNNKYEPYQVLIMADDGLGKNIKIPSIFLFNQEGERLKQLYDDSANEQNQNKSLVVKINFPTEQRDPVHYSFFITTPDKQAYTFIRKFDILRDFVEENTKFTPRYSFYQCKDESSKINNCNLDENCYGNYCCHDYDGPTNPGTGAQVAQENLRQLCIFHKFGQNAWFKYIEHFQNCNTEHPTTYQQCSEDIIGEIGGKYGINQNVIKKCVEEQGVKQEVDDEFNPYESSTFMGFNVQFEIHINNITVQGSYTPSNIVYSICKNMQTVTQNCDKFLYGTSDQIKDHLKTDEVPGDNDEESGIGVVGIVLITVSVLIVVFLIILVIYVKIVNRQVEQDMNTQVSEMVSNYIKFYEAKEKSSRDQSAQEV